MGLRRSFTIRSLLLVLATGFFGGGDAMAPGQEALALDCPAGWQVRGLNCCRVRGGQVQCQRNVRLPDALVPLSQ